MAACLEPALCRTLCRLLGVQPPTQHECKDECHVLQAPATKLTGAALSFLTSLRLVEPPTEPALNSRGGLVSFACPKMKVNLTQPCGVRECAYRTPSAAFGCLLPSVWSTSDDRAALPLAVIAALSDATEEHVAAVLRKAIFKLTGQHRATSRVKKEDKKSVGYDVDLLDCIMEVLREQAHDSQPAYAGYVTVLADSIVQATKPKE